MIQKYPRLTRTDVRDFVDKVVRIGATNESVEAFFMGLEFPAKTAEEIRISKLVQTIVTDCDGATDRGAEPIEAKHSGNVHALLDSLPDEALGDEGFWSYLATRFFWEFVKIRQASAWADAVGEPSNPDKPESEKQKLERYLVGRDHYQIPLRMYLRGQAIKNDDDYSLALVDGTDFWRSQILGVRTSAYPSLAKSVVSRQRDASLSIDEQRPPGRRVNRFRANIEFALFTEEEANALVKPIWVAPVASNDPVD